MALATGLTLHTDWQIGILQIGDKRMFRKGIITIEIAYYADMVCDAFIMFLQ